MHIIFNKEELNKALHILSKAAQTRISSNIPGTIYITTEGSKIRLEANDFEMAIIVTLDGEIKEEGTLLLASKYFQDMVRKMPGSTISLERKKDENAVLIQSGSAEFQMVTYDENEFTVVEKIEAQKSITIDTKDFKNLIDLTNFAVSNDETRRIFTGQLVELDGQQITMAGTDTYRLAVKEVTNDDAIDEYTKLIIPGRVLNELAKLIPVEEPQVLSMEWNDQKVAFSFENVYMTCRVIEGNYPDYKAVIPSSIFAKAMLDRQELMNALELATLVTKDASYHAVRFDWTADKLLITSRNVDIGTAKEEVPCTYEGQDFTVTFNGRYIMDILRHGTSEYVYFHLNENGILLVRMDDNPNYLYVATPVRADS